MTGNRLYFNYLAVLVLYVLSDTCAEHDSADKRAHTADGMYCGRACEVMKSELCEPALRVPYPACLNRVNDCRNDCRIYSVCAEFCTFRHSAGNYRRSRRTEYEVKYKACGVGFDKRAEVGENLKIWNAYKAEYVIFSHHERKA